MKFLLLTSFVFVFSLFYARSSFAAQITGLSYTYVSSTSLTITWNNQGGAAYRTLLSSFAAFTNPIVDGITPMDSNTTSYLNLVPNTSYAFLVKVDGDPDSTRVPISTFTLAVSPGIVSFQIFGTSVSVTLSPGLNTTNYLTLQVTTGNAGNFDVALSSSVRATGANNTETVVLSALSLNALTPNTTYAFQARARNASDPTVFASSGTTVILGTTTLAVP
ncbi:MAG: hypothetical protein HYY63_02255, partial [Elusimicrobia bacterium]|nr:hypothetical protein [Elusimicrobiota bacterium]